jgi:thymidylate kinase
MYTAPNGSQCFIVAIEGPDRVGKATQAAKLEEALTAHKHKATVEEVPYDDGVTHRQIYRMLHSGAVNEHPIVFQTLQGANRRYFQRNFLPTLATHYDVLILDRWTLSTRVYGEASGVSRATTDAILEGVIDPDLTLVFDGQPFPKEGLDVWEGDLEFQRKVRELYLHAVTSAGDHFVKIDATQSKDEVHQACLEAVLRRLR